MPHRKKKSSKPLGRSVSDASQKKPKKSSIFNILSKRSDPNLNTVNASDPINGVDSYNNNHKQMRRPVGRSKSDVGYNSSDSTETSNRSRSQTLERKRIKVSESDESTSKAKKKSQLSPIIENPPAEKYFGFPSNEQKFTTGYNKFEKKPLTTSNRSHNNHNSRDLDVDRNNTIKRTTDQLKSEHMRNNDIYQNHSRSLENLHSLQSPQKRLPKENRIDGMVKRLSMERFSPPPTLSSPAFSYTRPLNESIVYAQVLRDDNGEKSKRCELLPSLNQTKAFDSIRDRSPLHDIFGLDTVDNVGSHITSPNQQTLSKKFRSDKSKESRNIPIEHYRISPENPLFESNTRFIHQSSGEPPIIPNLKPSYGSMEHLANRRKLLESKIQERLFDFSRDFNRKPTPKPEKLSSMKPEEYNINGNSNSHENEKPIITSTPRKKWTNQPRYYPETNLNDEFCIDMDTIQREQERQRHKHYLNNEFRRILPDALNHTIDLGYIDKYDKSYLLNNNSDIINNKNLSSRHTPRKKSWKSESNDFTNANNTYHIKIDVERGKLDKADSGIEHDFKRNNHRSESTSR